MARPSSEFELAWKSLSGEGSALAWNAIGLEPSGMVAVQAGRRSPDNAEAILFSFPNVRLPAAEKLPEGQGFSVERISSSEAGGLRLALSRRASGSLELFLAMACDIVGALDEAAAVGTLEAKLMRVLLRRIGAWQEFMRKGASTLSAEAEIGLIGELLILKEILETGTSPAAALSWWVGPLDGVQDFQVGAGAIEAKATLSAAGFPARIGSLEQLDDSARQPIFVGGVRLRVQEAGFGIASLVADLREAVRIDSEAARLLDEKLVAAGYLDLHAGRYNRRFHHLETRAVLVTCMFPRLTPGSVPLGVTRAAYDIDLDKATGERSTVSEALKKLGMA